jgi:intracellular multiplication protein IcmG
MADEEYKFKAEEYDIPEERPPAEQPPGMGFGKRTPKFKVPINKRVLIILGIVIVVFIVFQFVKPKTAKEIQPSIPDVTVAVPISQASANGQLFDLTQKFDKNNTKIKDMEDQLNKTQAVLSKLNTNVSNLNSAVRRLSASTQLLAKRQAEMLVYGTGKAKTRGSKVVYHVRAIVPGRAWLEASDGTFVTVRSGSELNHYGTVTRIDDRRGIVQTDLGFTIKYGKGDI